MILTKSTKRTHSVLGINYRIYAYGGLSVCFEVTDVKNPEVNYKVDLTKSDLKNLLSYIERREEEIDLEMEEWRSSKKDGE